MFRLESDFTDYYDSVINPDSKLVYKRKRLTFNTRVDELLYLRNNGIKTVQFGPLGKFPSSVKKLIVYTNPSLHNFKGKHIYTYDEVASQYTNYMVAEFLEPCNGYTVKYLQIGERRFRLMFFNPNFEDTLTEGKLITFDELPRQYNYAIGLPIYSIDYVSNGTEMVAVDFNEVQQLNTIGIDKIIKPEDVAAEVYKSLLAYNKA